MNLDVGIDVGKTTLAYCGITSLYNDGDKPAFRGETSNDEVGFLVIKTAILDWIKKLGDDTPIEQMLIGMEATSVYHTHLMKYMAHDLDLNAYQTIIVPLNPKSASDWRKAYNDEKTDRKDAEHIATQLKAGRFKAAINRSEEYLALQRLTRERTMIVRKLAEAKNHYLNNLFLKLNTADSTIAASAFSTTMLELLSGVNYTLSDLSKMSLKQLTDIVRQYSRGAFKDPEEIAKSVKKSIKTSYTLDKLVADSVDLTLSTYYQQIKMYQSQIKQFDKTIDQLAETLPAIKCLRSIPGVGPVYAAGIAAEIGQIERFGSDASIAKYAGIVWLRNQSGHYEQEVKKRPKSGDQYLRFYLVEAADSVRQHDQVFADFYAKKYKEVNNHQHQRACVLTARKLIRVIFTLLKNGQLYEPRY